MVAVIEKKVERTDEGGERLLSAKQVWRAAGHFCLWTFPIEPKLLQPHSNINN